MEVQAVIRALNEAHVLRTTGATDADGKSLLPLDWLPTTVVADDVSRARTSAHSSGLPYDRATATLAKFGLSLSDLLRCKHCLLWFLSSSRKAAVCSDCRARKWPTAYRRQHRAKLAQLSGLRPRTRKK